jgi:hypothetical protein
MQNSCSDRFTQPNVVLPDAVAQAVANFPGRAVDKARTSNVGGLGPGEKSRSDSTQADRRLYHLFGNYHGCSQAEPL